MTCPDPQSPINGYIEVSEYTGDYVFGSVASCGKGVAKLLDLIFGSLLSDGGRRPAGIRVYRRGSGRGDHAADGGARQRDEQLVAQPACTEPRDAARWAGSWREPNR